MNLFQNNEINNSNYPNNQNSSPEKTNEKLSKVEILSNSISSDKTNITDDNNNNNNISTDKNNSTNESSSSSYSLTKQPNEQEIRINKKNTISLAFIDIASGLVQFSTLSIQYFFKDVLKANPSQLSIVNSIIRIPSISLPLFGLITDMFPLLGYRRKSYIILFSFIDSLLWLAMTCFNNSIISAVIILFLESICRSFNSVIIDAIVVEINNKEKQSTIQKQSIKKGSHMNQSFIFKFIGILIASISRIIFVQYISIYYVFFIASLFPIINIISGFNYYETKTSKASYKNLVEENIQGNLENSELQNSSKENKQLPYNKPIKQKSVKTFLSLILTKTIFVPLLFLIFLSSMPSTMDSSFYYLSDEKGFNSQSFDLFSLFITISMLTTMFFYKRYLDKKKTTTIISGCLLCSFLCGCIFNVWIIFDWRSKFILYLSFISCIVMKIFAMIPVMNLASLICPKDFEGSVFSLFISSNSLGGVLSSLVSSVIVFAFDIRKGNYKNFNRIVFFVNVCRLLPILVMKFIPQTYLNYESQKRDDEVNMKDNENEVNIELGEVGKSNFEMKENNENEERLDKE